jgi:hypothetical protein
VAWDEVRLLSGSPDREVTLARRSGDHWWIGSVSALDGHVQKVALKFLAPGRTYDMHLVKDDGNGGLEVEDRAVGAADTLAVGVEHNGGFAAELVPRG